MDSFCESQLMAVSVLPMVSGVISSLGSGTIIFSIFRSTVKLQVPYRRFIFGLSCYDLLVSSVYALSTIPMPKEKSMIPQLSFGNDGVCTAQGSLFVIGYLGSIIYSFNLAMYYFCTLRLKMSKADFKKYEIIFHSFANFWPLLAVSVMLLDDSINPSWTHCTVAPNPVNCIKNNDLECVSGRNAYLYQWIFIADVQAVAYGSIIVTFISIVCMQWRQENTNRSRFHQQQRNDNEDGRKASIVRKLSSIFRRTSIDEDIQTEGLTKLEIWQRKRNARMIQASEDRERQVKNQALLYIGGFFIGYIFFSIAAVDVMKAEKFSFELILLREIFYPLQGFINIFVYTYPHVSALRKGDANLSWFRAFFRTIKNGGDHDDMSNFRNIRRHSIGQQPSEPSSCHQMGACFRNAIRNFCKKLRRCNLEQRNVSRKSPAVTTLRRGTMAPTPPREEKTTRENLGRNISSQLQSDDLDDIECPAVKNTVVLQRVSNQDNVQEDEHDIMKEMAYIERNYT